ncbi:MAG: ABC transporter permease [Alphaproteobacteria bacterium]|nr:ABC transporter permease [Alphaproteobacteria bacterium]
MNFELMAEAFPQLIEGIPLTLQLVFLSLAIGFVLAVVIALARLAKDPVLPRLAYGFVYVFRGTPLLVQIFLIYYGLGQFEAVRESILWIVLKEPFWCAIIALALNTGAYTSEIIRGGIQSVPWGQIEAGKACGMSRVLLFRRIVFPVAIRQALPAYGNEIILMVKSTSLASTITILEVTGIAKKLISATWQPIEIFLVAGAIYLTMNFIVTRGIAMSERRLNPHLKDRPLPKRTALDRGVTAASAPAAAVPSKPAE